MTFCVHQVILCNLKIYLQSVSEPTESQWFDRFKLELEQNYGKRVNEVAHWVVSAFINLIKVSSYEFEGCQVLFILQYSAVCDQAWGEQTDSWIHS